MFSHFLPFAGGELSVVFVSVNIVGGGQSDGGAAGKRLAHHKIVVTLTYDGGTATGGAVVFIAGVVVAPVVVAGLGHGETIIAGITVSVAHFPVEEIALHVAVIIDISRQSKIIRL